MDKKLQNKLVKDFPELFSQIHLSVSESCMGQGIACGDGWYELIVKVCNRLEFEGLQKIVEFGQIKEKFGRLTIYFDLKEGYDVIPDKAWEIVSEAASASLITCEWCAEPAELRNGSWLHVLCDKCEEKYEKGVYTWLKKEEQD